MKTQYKYNDPSAISYEELHSRLYVSQYGGVHIYSVVQFLEIKLLHTVKVDCGFKKLIVNHGFLLGLAEKGFLTAFQLRPPQKEGLISVTTNVNLPEGVRHIVGSPKNRRLIVTYYNQSIVLIDTVEGPIFSKRMGKTDKIVSIYSNKEANQVIAVGQEGSLAIAELSEVIL